MDMPTIATLTHLLSSIGTMISKIFHPNISKTGEICVDTLKKGWKREYGIGHVLVVSARSVPCCLL